MAQKEVSMKPFWHSKTLWFNVGTIVVLVIGHILNEGLISDPEVVKWIAEALAIINILLRFDTSTKLTLK